MLIFWNLNRFPCNFLLNVWRGVWDMLIRHTEYIQDTAIIQYIILVTFWNVLKLHINYSVIIMKKCWYQLHMQLLKQGHFNAKYAVCFVHERILAILLLFCFAHSQFMSSLMSPYFSALNVWNYPEFSMTLDTYTQQSLWQNKQWAHSTLRLVDVSPYYSNATAHWDLALGLVLIQLPLSCKAPLSP